MPLCLWATVTNKYQRLQRVWDGAPFKAPSQTQTQMLTVYFMPQLHLKLGEGFFIWAKNVAEEVKNQFQFSDILDR